MMKPKDNSGDNSIDRDRRFGGNGVERMLVAVTNDRQHKQPGAAN